MKYSSNSRAALVTHELISNESGRTFWLLCQLQFEINFLLGVNIDLNR